MSRKSQPGEDAKTYSELKIVLSLAERRLLTRAARNKGLNLVDYVKSIVIEQARCDTRTDLKTIKLSPQEQLEFWNALNAAPRLTKVQKELGLLMKRSP